jgi:hypothetical protein
MAESWDMKGENSDLVVEGLSWLDSDSYRWVSLWSVGKEEFSKSNLGSLFLPLEFCVQMTLRR